MTLTDAATRLGVKRQRVSVLVKEGRIKAKRVAGQPFISDRELDRFAAIPRKGGRPSSKQ
jgi:excisionase family DNA binding protein